MCSKPTPVSKGYYTVGTSKLTKYTQAPCDKGWWCTGGLRYLCNAGFYGAEMAMSNPGRLPRPALPSPPSFFRPAVNPSPESVVEDAVPMRACVACVQSARGAAAQGFTAPWGARPPRRSAAVALASSASLALRSRSQCLRGTTRSPSR